MEIKPMQRREFRQIWEMTSEEFPYANISPEKILERIDSGKNFFFKISEKENIVGFIELGIENKKGRINGLSIKKGWRKKGLGKSLLGFGINFLKILGAEKISLFVKRENFAAKEIYSKSGFETTRTLEKKIDGSTVEEMVFEKELGKAS
jgi:ribosomal protein S18 acetylase RimI-like enzyme